MIVCNLKCKIKNIIKKDLHARYNFPWGLKEQEQKVIFGILHNHQERFSLFQKSTTHSHTFIIVLRLINLNCTLQKTRIKLIVQYLNDKHQIIYVISFVDFKKKSHNSICFGPYGYGKAKSYQKVLPMLLYFIISDLLISCSSYVHINLKT